MNIFPISLCSHIPGVYCDYCRPVPFPVPEWFPFKPIIVERLSPIVVEEKPKKLKRGQVFEDESGKLHIFDGSKWITIEEEKKNESESETMLSV